MTIVGLAFSLMLACSCSSSQSQPSPQNIGATPQKTPSTEPQPFEIEYVSRESESFFRITNNSHENLTLSCIKSRTDVQCVSFPDKLLRKADTNSWHPWIHFFRGIRMPEDLLTDVALPKNSTVTVLFPPADKLGPLPAGIYKLIIPAKTEENQRLQSLNVKLTVQGRSEEESEILLDAIKRMNQDRCPFYHSESLSKVFLRVSEQRVRSRIFSVGDLPFRKAYRLSRLALDYPETWNKLVSTVGFGSESWSLAASMVVSDAVGDQGIGRDQLIGQRDLRRAALRMTRAVEEDEAPGDHFVFLIHALNSLEPYWHPSTPEVLLDRFRTDQDTRNRCCILDALSHSPERFAPLSTEFLPILNELAHHEQQTIRDNARLAACKIQHYGTSNPASETCHRAPFACCLVSLGNDPVDSWDELIKGSDECSNIARKVYPIVRSAQSQEFLPIRIESVDLRSLDDI